MAQRYSIAAAARLCGCPRSTLQRAIRAGRLHLDASYLLEADELTQAGYLTQAAAQQPQAPAARQARAIPPDALVALLRDMQRTMERIAGAVETLTSEMRTMQQRSMPPRDSRAAVAPQDAPLAPPHPSPMLLGTYDPHVATARIQDLRRQGWSLTRIADQLTAEGIPTRYGLPWQYSSVRHLLKTYGKEHEG